MALIGMVLAAGFGTRLAEAWPGVPKPLVPVAGRPMIAHAIEALRDAGCARVVVNAHYLAEQLAAHLAAVDYGVPVLLSAEPDILGTGGALSHAQALLRDADEIVLHNADIVSDADLRALLEQRREGGALASLLVQQRACTRAVLADESMRFLGKEVWFETGAPAGSRRYGFCGVHALSSAVLDVVGEPRFVDIFDVYREAMEAGKRLLLHEHGGYWSDLGTAERIAAHEAHLRAAATAM